MSLSYAVITSVTRDDLSDGGASFFHDTVANIKKISPMCAVEVLVPDFKGNMTASINKIISSNPDIINHNIEVSKNLYDKLRPLGSYEKSLELISYVNKKGLKAKSGLMIGFGETLEDISSALQDLYFAGCSFVTIGQYLKSMKTNCPVKKYYTPEEFVIIKRIAEQIGFEKVMSGPLVRSSYHAKEMSASL
jgi:lipoyl synthase